MVLRYRLGNILTINSPVIGASSSSPGSPVTVDVDFHPFTLHRDVTRAPELCGEKKRVVDDTSSWLYLMLEESRSLRVFFDYCPKIKVQNFTLTRLPLTKMKILLAITTGRFFPRGSGNFIVIIC